MTEELRVGNNLGSQQLFSERAQPAGEEASRAAASNQQRESGSMTSDTEEKDWSVLTCHAASWLFGDPWSCHCRAATVAANVTFRAELASSSLSAN